MQQTSRTKQLTVHVVSYSLHLHKELCFNPSCRFTFVVGTGRAQRVHLVNEYNARLVFSGHFEKVLHQFLGFTQPFGYQVRTGIVEDATLALVHQIMRVRQRYLDTEKNVELFASVATALAKYDFPVPGGPNNKIPRQGFRFPKNYFHSMSLYSYSLILSLLIVFPHCIALGIKLTFEKMREFDGQDDGLFERLFGLLQPGHVRPLDVRFLHDNRAFQLSLHLLLLRVVAIRIRVVLGVVFFGTVASTSLKRRTFIPCLVLLS